jgi:DNA-binding NarL/FixJ family response regulator
VRGAAASGAPSKEIGRRLAISERTVKAHLTSLYTKPGVDSRAAAVAAALSGWLKRTAPALDLLGVSALLWRG